MERHTNQFEQTLKLFKCEEKVNYLHAGGAGSEVWNRVYMIAPVKKFGRGRLRTNFPSKQIWQRMRTWKDDEFLLGFTFYGVQTSRKGFHELFSGNFWTSGGVMYDQFMSDFAHRDSAPWQAQLFISFVNFRATSLRAACSISYIFFSPTVVLRTLCAILDICYELIIV